MEENIFEESIISGCFYYIYNLFKRSFNTIGVFLNAGMELNIV